VVFDHGEPADIYVVSADGGKPLQLTSHPAPDILPAWSRDGEWIYFSSTRSGRGEIWKIPGTGGVPLQVTEHGGLWCEESYEGWLYYTKKPDGDIWKAPKGGGEETIVLERKPGWGGRDWCLTSEGIYFLRVERDPLTLVFRYLNLRTGEIQEVYRWETQFGNWGFLAVSPDRKWLFTSFAEPDRGADIMLVENFR
jgi:hypothetical protein